MGAGAVGEKVELLLLDPILHIAAGTVEILIAGARGKALRGVGNETGGGNIGDDEARVVATREYFGFTDHPADPAPTVKSLIGEIHELASLAATETGLYACPEKGAHKIFLENTRLRTASANGRHNLLQSFDGALARIDIAGAQLRPYRD